MFAYEIPPPDNVLHLSVLRLAGTSGRLVAYWEAQPITADLNDFSPVSGNITFQDGQVNHGYRLTRCNYLNIILSGLCFVFIKPLERIIDSHHDLG